ncbi:MAG: T9SS type A sorting domain-containing protein [Saprospiraceae bacterium]|nr:T9SS type A sorting domain-containing protein [Saprospiraceae bacterium]
MKKVSTWTLIGLLFCCLNFSYAQRNCGAMEHLENQLQQNPSLQFNMDQIEEHTRNFIKRSEHLQKAVITIPVVVHVVYNGSAENVSDAQIQSQIDVLNEDFRRQNSDANNTPSIFAGVASDVEIEFCLASVDPDGNSTNGITRTPTSKRSFRTNDDVKKANKGGKAAWPAGDYMNMWVCDIAGGILGYAQFPGGPASTDGIVVDYQYFGTIGTATAPFNLGRTATHEVGHWLNLRHIWGDGGCGVDDFVSDTPIAGGPNYTGEPCNSSPNSCNEGSGDLPDMFQNYMDYSDDACMNLFTDGQTARMRALFGSGGSRASLLNSNGCGSGNGGPTCSDGVQNGNETGVDCGGPDCAPCETEPTCDDGVQNGSETGVDCGGPDCAPCDTGSCDAPSGLSSTPRGGGKRANLSWNAVSGASSYTLTLQQIAPSTGSVSSTTTSGTSVNASGLTRGNTYQWTVTANCSSGSSPTSTATFVAGQSARLTDQDQDLLVYPNPTGGRLVVDFSDLTVSPELTLSAQPKAANYILNVMDVHGRVLQQYNIAEGAEITELNVSSLVQGLYILRLTDRRGEQIANTKFLVSK